MSADLEREIGRVWAVADRDRSGFVDASETRALMTQLNGGKPISDRELADAMRALDSDGDGRVTFAEFSHAMKEWMGATAHESIDLAAAAQTGALAGAAAALDASTAAADGSLRSASRKNTHKGIASFFSNFSKESFAEAAQASVQDVYSKDAGASMSSWPLIEGRDGLFSRMSPYGAAARSSLSGEERLEALKTASDVRERLPFLRETLKQSQPFSVWMDAVKQIRLMLSLGIVSLLLPMLHPNTPAIFGLREGVFEVDTLHLAMLQAANGGVEAAASTEFGQVGTKRKFPSTAFDPTEDFLRAKRRLVSVTGTTIPEPGVAVLIDHCVTFTPAVVRPSDAVSAEEWHAFLQEVILVLAYMSLGPRLPHTPTDSFWHPSNVWQGTKTMLIYGLENSSAISWLLFHIMHGVNEGVRLSSACLVAAIASFNKDCHYAVTVNHASVYSLLNRIHLTRDTDNLESLEVLTACLSVLCGATLPPDCLTVYALTETMCGASLFPTLATFLEVQADPNIASPALRIRAHAVAALTYLLPLLNVQEEWTSVRHVVDTLGFAAATSFETLSANSVASTSMQRLFSSSVFTGTALAAVAHLTGGVEAFQDSELFTIHSAIVRTALRCLRYMAIVGEHVTVAVSLGSLATASAAVLAAHAVIQHSPGTTDAEVAALTAEAITSNQDVRVKASEYILSATTALEVIAGCLHQTGPMFDMIRDAALCFLVSCVKNAHAEQRIFGTAGILPGIILCLHGTEELQSRAAALLLDVVQADTNGASCRLLLQCNMPTELAKPLTANLGGDEVIAETFADLQKRGNFSFIRDAVKALGTLFDRMWAACKTPDFADVFPTLIAQYSLDVVAALNMCMHLVLSDARRTLAMQLNSVPIAFVREQLNTLDAFRSFLRTPVDGVDAARDEADADIRRLFGILLAAHKEAKSSTTVSGPVIMQINNIAHNIEVLEQELFETAKHIALGTPLTASDKGSKNGKVKREAIKVHAEVAPNIHISKKMQHRFKPFEFPCNVDTPLETIVSKIRAAYDHDAGVAYVARDEDGKMYCFDLGDDAALAHAHECRVAARQHKLYLIAYHYSIGLPRPHGTEAAKYVAWTKAGEGAGAMTVDEGNHGPVTPTVTNWGQNIAFEAEDVSFGDAVFNLWETCGNQVVQGVGEAGLRVLYDLLMSKMKSMPAGTATGLTFNEFATFLLENKITSEGDENFYRLLFELVDSDRSSTVSFQEMAVALAIMMGGGLASTIQRAFTTFDVNGDNQLDREEIHHLIRAVTHRPERECLDIASHLFTLYDADGDGYFNLNEFQIAAGADSRLTRAFWPYAQSAIVGDDPQG